MQAIGLVFVLAVLVEGLVEYLGTPLPSKAKPYAAALVGVALCVAYNADLLGLLGYQAGVPYVGAVLTGLLIGRGSNYLSDLVSRLNTIQLPATTVSAVEEKVERQEAARDAGLSAEPPRVI